MKSCCVSGCKGPPAPDPVFFELPSSRLLRKRWLDAINCSAAEDGAAVCIRHFAREDYELVRGAATLRSRSVPSRRIRESDDESSESGSDSSESETSNRIKGKDTANDNGDNGKTKNDNGKIDNDNGKIENDNGKIDNDNGKIDNDNGKIYNDNGKAEVDGENKDRDSQIENGPPEDNTCTDKVNTDNSNISLEDKSNVQINNESRIVSDDNEMFNNDNVKTNDDNEKLNNDNGKSSNDNGITSDENKKLNNDNGKTSDDNEKLNNDNGKTSDDNEKLNNDNVKTSDDNVYQNDDNGKTNDYNVKPNNDNGKMTDDNVKISNDNGNSENKVKGRKTRCKITAMRAINGRRRVSFSSDSSNSDSDSSSPRTEPEGSKEDIEEALQYYYIENKKTERQVAAMSDVIKEQQEKVTEESLREPESEPSQPVFIELSVGQGPRTEGQEPAESDCLMLLESVQCEVDPAMLLAAREEDEANMEQVDLDDDDDDEDEPEFVPKKKEDPISLLTSSDEDDVIIEEPKYDLVEVSSADTSEDDMPLVKLVKPSSKSSQNDAKKMKMSAKHTKNLITKLLWGRNDFYCVHCRFTTVNASEYTKHMAVHSNTVLPTQHKIIQYCHDCGFTTSSKHQLQKHKQKHKSDKRYKCPKCHYSAKHKMSLVYHMKTHKNSGLNEVELAICGTYEPTSEKSGKSEKSKKSKSSETSKISENDKKYKCDSCGYKTNRRSDLKRHRRRLHDGDDDDDDDEYKP